MTLRPDSIDRAVDVATGEGGVAAEVTHRGTRPW
jgi:hypothetical protein